MTATGIADLAERPVDELSGGQRQRGWIAMALAQRTDILLLDEPTTFLDLSHQLDVLDLLLDLNAARGTTVVMVLHDLNLAARYAGHLVAMRAGAVVAAGEPSSVVTAELVREVFGVESVVAADPVTGTPLVVPLGRHHTVGGGAAGVAAHPDDAVAVDGEGARPGGIGTLLGGEDAAVDVEVGHARPSFPSEVRPSTA